MSRQGMDVFMLFLMIETLKTECSSVWEALIHDSFPGEHITFHMGVLWRPSRSCQAGPGGFGWIALSNLLSFLRSLVNSFICWDACMALLESSIIWHTSTAAQLLEPTSPNPWNWLPALWDLRYQECHLQSPFNGERICPPFKGDLPYIIKPEPTKYPDPGLYNE